MWEKIKEHLVELVIAALFSVLFLYTVPTVYKLSIEFENFDDQLEENNTAIINAIEETKIDIKELKILIAQSMLRDGTLTEDNIDKVLSIQERDNFLESHNATKYVIHHTDDTTTTVWRLPDRSTSYAAASMEGFYEYFMRETLQNINRDINELNERVINLEMKFKNTEEEY